MIQMPNLHPNCRQVLRALRYWRESNLYVLGLCSQPLRGVEDAMECAAGAIVVEGKKSDEGSSLFSLFPDSLGTVKSKFKFKFKFHVHVVLAVPCLPYFSTSALCQIPWQEEHLQC